MSCPVFDVFLESGKEGWVLVLEKCFCVQFSQCKKGKWRTGGNNQHFLPGPKPHSRYNVTFGQQ